jgi:ubiquinone/menaquinone biosynthesis C-methylase UbiE
MGLLGLLATLKRAHAKDIAPAITGVKMGDRVLFAGTDDIRLVTELATRAGLTGRVVALADTPEAARDRTQRIEAAGGLVEGTYAPLTMLPFDAESFDVAVAEEILLQLDAGRQRSAIAELLRVVRPGGRLLWIERQPRAGLFRLAPDSRELPDAAARERVLSETGFRGVRTLASAEGRTYVEGIKSAI